MSVRTRRQKAAAAAVDEQPASTANGVAHTTSTPKKAEKEPQENIFLFWPNLVGKPRSPYAGFLSSCAILEC
jgi:CDP-diacylglycerol--inositol 3-phosphatidyltransferase